MPKKLPDEPNELPCEKCQARISTDEYIVNWGWCNKCFDDSYKAYMKRADPEAYKEYYGGS